MEYVYVLTYDETLYEIKHPETGVGMASELAHHFEHVVYRNQETAENFLDIIRRNNVYDGHYEDYDSDWVLVDDGSSIYEEINRDSDEVTEDEIVVKVFRDLDTGWEVFYRVRLSKAIFVEGNHG